MEKKDEDQNSLRELMKGFFSTEEFGVRANNHPSGSKEAELATKLTADSLKYEVQYEIVLLWKNPNKILPDSYDQALRRFKGHERKMAEDKELKEWYCKQIPDYIQKGYVRKAVPYELLDTSDKINYILHFVVINRNKPIHKPRLVFGAAAKKPRHLIEF